MNISKFSIPGLVLVQPKVFRDDRGYFFENWHNHRFKKTVANVDFVQDNISYSKRGTLRGLHLQFPQSQGKLVTVLQGSVFDVAVDVRKGSPTYGQWQGVYLSHENQHQFYIPPGFAHGFVALTDGCLFSYKCTDYYNPDAEITIHWNDLEIGIDWPKIDSQFLVSDKDARGMKLSELSDEKKVLFVETSKGSEAIS